MRPVSCMAGSGDVLKPGLTTPLCSAGKLFGGDRLMRGREGLKLGLTVRELPQPPGGVMWWFRLEGGGALKSTISAPTCVLAARHRLRAPGSGLAGLPKASGRANRAGRGQN